jgi:hypothetical protein
MTETHLSVSLAMFATSCCRRVTPTSNVPTPPRIVAVVGLVDVSVTKTVLHVRDNTLLLSEVTATPYV